METVMVEFSGISMTNTFFLKIAVLCLGASLQSLRKDVNVKVRVHLFRKDALFNEHLIKINKVAAHLGDHPEESRLKQGK